MEKKTLTNENSKNEERDICDEDIIVDMHCHSALKPFNNILRGMTHDNNPRSRSSIWHYDPPTCRDKIRNRLYGIARFSQTNFTALAKGKGKVKIVVVSLYPIEKGYLNLWGHTGKFTDFLIKFATEIPYARIDDLQEHQDYFRELQKEYNFYDEYHGEPINSRRLGKNEWKYKLTKNFHDIKLNDDEKNTIWVIISIEGCNVFNTGLERCIDEEEVIRNIYEIKNVWEYKPLFISIAHHFYNGLCGHAESFSELVGSLLDQKEGVDTGFTPLGENVLKALLDNSEKNRIYIDIKHMSVQSRREYYDILLNEYKLEKDQIPIIVSHGAVNGLKSFDKRCVQIPTSSGKFNRLDVNIFDFEIVKIFKTGGFLGIQPDSRRIASQHMLYKAKLKDRRGIWHFLFKQFRRKKYKTDIRKNLAGLVWNQIQHIAEVLDKYNEFGWGTTTLGSDFDGMVKPLEGYWTAEEYELLKKDLIEHAISFKDKTVNKNWNDPKNKSISYEEIIDNFMCKNAIRFLRKKHNEIRT